MSRAFFSLVRRASAFPSPRTSVTQRINFPSSSSILGGRALGTAVPSDPTNSSLNSHTATGEPPVSTISYSRNANSGEISSVQSKAFTNPQERSTLDSGLQSEHEVLSSTAIPAEAVDTVNVVTSSSNSVDGVAGLEAVTELTSSAWSDVFLHPATSLLSFTHDVTGMPWWLTIGAATIAVRTMILPVSLYTMRSASLLGAIQDDLKRMRDDVALAVRSGNRELVKEKQQAQRDFMRRAGVTPTRAFLGPLVQFPVFITFFVSIRRLSQSHPEFATGGAAWFVDLASKDATMFLPLLAGITLLIMTELGADSGNRMTPQMKMIMRAVGIVSVPMTSWLPAAVFCYWIPNNLFSISLTSLAKVPTIRRSLGLVPDLKTIQRAKDAALSLKRADPIKPVDPMQAARSYFRKDSQHAPTPKVSLGQNGLTGSAKLILHKTKPASKKTAASQ